MQVRTGIDVLTQSHQRRADSGDEEAGEEEEEEESLAAEVVDVLQSGLLEARLQELQQEVSDVGLELLELTEQLNCGRPQLLEWVLYRVYRTAVLDSQVESWGLCV